MIALAPAWTGVLVWLGLGWALYRVSTGLIDVRLRRELKTGEEWPGLPRLGRFLRLIKIGLAAASFTIFPALGYAVGRASGP